MSNKFEYLKFYLGEGEDRLKNLEKVERHLQALGYKPNGKRIMIKKYKEFYTYVLTGDNGRYDIHTNEGFFVVYKDCPIPDVLGNKENEG